MDALLQLLQHKYLLEFPSTSLEVEVWGFWHNLTVEVFYVDVNLLPQSLDRQDIQAIHNVRIWGMEHLYKE